MQETFCACMQETGHTASLAFGSMQRLADIEAPRGVPGTLIGGVCSALMQPTEQTSTLVPRPAASRGVDPAVPGSRRSVLAAAGSPSALADTADQVRRDAFAPGAGDR